MTHDLTEGKPLSVLGRFCLPLLGSILFQQLYNMADSFVAGKFIGDNALAAVGNSYEITLIFIAFAFGCNMGCSVVVSQLCGAKQHREMKSAVTTTFLATGVLCVILMAGGLICSEWLLTLIKTPEEVFADSKLYLDIYIWGLPFMLFYNVSTGIFSALGDSKTPFYFLAASSLSNIGVDILFVCALHMGVAGVALATFLCQGVSCVLAVIFVLRRFHKLEADMEGEKERAPLFSWELFGRITKVAVPSILQQSFVSVGNIVIQGVVNGFGTVIMAGYAAAVKLNNMVVTSIVTLGNGLSTYTAQNTGADKPDRIRAGFPAGMCILWAVALPMAILFQIFGKLLVYIFLDDPSGAALDFGATFLRTISPFYLVISLKIAADSMLRGAGRMLPFTISTFLDLFLRVVLAITLSQTLLGTTGIGLAWPFGWSISAVVALVFLGLFLRTLPKKQQKISLF